MEENTLPESTHTEEVLTQEQYQIYSNAQRAKNLLIVFWLVFGITILAAVSDYYEIMLLQDLAEGKTLSEEVINNSDNRQQAIAIIQIVTLVVSAIFFIYWFRRAYGNLDRIRQRPEHSESMAVWGFVIPIISFFRPPQMMFEIWNKTQEKIKQLDEEYVIMPNRFSIAAWWLLFVVTHLLGRYILKSAFAGNQTIDDIIASSQAYMVSDILQVFEAFFVIVIVNNMTDIESKLADEVNKNGGTVYI